MGIKSKWSIYDDAIRSMYIEGVVPTELSKKILDTDESSCQNYDVRQLARYISRNYKNICDLHEGIYDAADSVDVSAMNAKHMWLKTKEASLFIKNPNYVEPEEFIPEDIDFNALFSNIQPIEHNYEPTINEAQFDRLVYTDTHVGMRIEDFSLYGGVWNEDELNKMLEHMVKHTLSCRKSSMLYIDDLGDFMDGYDAQTVRKGHDLPQNMDNQKAFDVGLSFKIRLLQSLAPYYNKIICHNICEDNHSGSFGYVVNSAFKVAIELMLDNVDVINIRKFIDYYSVGRYVFVLSHGKDSKSLKFGFKPKLDKIQENKIDNYLDRNGLVTKGCAIEFSKGDSHQYLFDTSTAQRFNYYNYPALSPSSSWVQTNFQQGVYGFIHFNYYENRKVINEFVIDLN